MRIDFYILSQSGESERTAFACRLAEKAYRLANTVHIHTASQAEAARLDDLLWTFRDGSFVPHELLDTDVEGAESPVTIGCVGNVEGGRDLLINLSDDIPEFAGSFARVAELVSADEQCRQVSRRRFAAYREMGHTPNTHHV